VRHLGSGIAIGLLLATSAAAHPGHGVTPDGWLHALTEPLHAAPLVLLVAGLWALRRRQRRRARVRIR